MSSKNIFVAVIMLALSSAAVTAPAYAVEAVRSVVKNEVSDNKIKDAILAQLRVNKNAKDLLIRVVSKKGLVTLTGTVPSSEIREEIEVLAENTSGVKEVISRISVNSQYNNDLIITKKVKSNLLNEKAVKSLDIIIETEDGNVTLTGEVPNVETRKLIELIATKSEGVTDITSRLTINSSLENK